jgi:hypothetical protein
LRSGFKVMGFADVSHEKRQWLIKHAYSMGITVDGLKSMNATQKEIDEAIESYNLGYFCCICNKPIKNDDVPMECREKISIQMTWHESCRN